MQEDFEVKETDAEKVLDFCFKLVMLGNSGVGKTILLNMK